MVDASVNQAPDVLEADHPARHAMPASQAGSIRFIDDVATRLYSDFGVNTTYAAVVALVEQCLRDLDCSRESASELVERLARQRLTDRLGPPSTRQ
jgi:hypothetical protein